MIRGKDPIKKAVNCIHRLFHSNNPQRQSVISVSSDHPLSDFTPTDTLKFSLLDQQHLARLDHAGAFQAIEIHAAAHILALLIQTIP